MPPYLQFLKQPRILVPISAVLGGIGALIFNWYHLFGGLLIVLGVVGALYSLRKSEATAKEYEDFIESQAFLIAKGGLGNTFTQSVKKELQIMPDEQGNYVPVFLLLANMGKRSEALAVCDQAIEKWPNFAFKGFCKTIAETNYVFRCVYVPGEGYGWRVEERKSSEAQE